MGLRSFLLVAAVAAGSLVAGSAQGGAEKLAVHALYYKRPCGEAPAKQVQPTSVSAGTVVLDRAGNGRPVRVSLLEGKTSPASFSLAGHGPVKATLVLETPRIRVVEGSPSLSAQQIPLGTATAHAGKLSFSVGRSDEDNGHVNTLIELQRAARVAAETAPRQLPLLIAKVYDGEPAKRPWVAYDAPNIIHVGRGPRGYQGTADTDAQWEGAPLAHEYGHFLLHEIAPDDPNATGDHDVARSYPKLPTLAWSEGFPFRLRRRRPPDWGGRLYINCGRPYANFASTPAVPALATAEDKRYAQSNETRAGGVAYQLIGHLGGGKAGLRRLLAALPRYKRGGHSVWTLRDLRDLAAQQLDKTAADHAAVDRIFVGQGVSWSQGIAIAVDRANFPQEVAASSELVVRVTGPGGFDCTSKADIDPATTAKLDSGIAIGTKVADGGLSFSADDDCYLVSGDGKLPDDPPRTLFGDRATMPFPFLSSLAHWSGKFTVLAKYVCEFDDRLGPREVFQCPTTIGVVAGPTSPYLLTLVPELRAPKRMTLTRNVECPGRQIRRRWSLPAPRPGQPDRLRDGTAVSARRRGLLLWPLLLVGCLVLAGFRDGRAARSGAVVGWGCQYPAGYAADNHGQCSVPPAARKGIVAVSAGQFAHSLALTTSGRAIAWGCRGKDFGQCRVPATATTGVVSVAAGWLHSLALKRDGSVVAWGCGGPGIGYDHGQCDVPAAARSGVKAIAAGDTHSLALQKDGSVVAWGCTHPVGGVPSAGQCRVPAAARSGVTAIAANSADSLALRKNGSVVAWGCGELDHELRAVPRPTGGAVGRDGDRRRLHAQAWR